MRTVDPWLIVLRLTPHPRLSAFGLMDDGVCVGNAGKDATVNRGYYSWFAEDDSVVMTLRWPSVSGYAVPDGESAARPK